LGLTTQVRTLSHRMISESHNPFVPIDYFVVLFKHFFYPSTIHHCVLHFPKQKFDTKDPNGDEHGALLPRFPSRIFGKRSNRTEDKNPASVCPNRAQSLKIYLERTQLLLHFTPFQKEELVISPISRISVIGAVFLFHVIQTSRK